MLQHVVFEADMRVSVLQLVPCLQWGQIEFSSFKKLYNLRPVREAEHGELSVMDIHCNESILANQTQMESSIYHLIEMVITCVGCSLNTMLSLPLAWVIARSPSLLRHTRFLLLAHLLLCDNLQVRLNRHVCLSNEGTSLELLLTLRWECALCPSLKFQQLIWTIKAVLLKSREEMPVIQCLIFSSAIQACSMVCNVLIYICGSNFPFFKLSHNIFFRVVCFSFFFYHCKFNFGCFWQLVRWLKKHRCSICHYFLQPIK